MRCIIRNQSLKCSFMYESSAEYGIVEHWLSEVKALEMKNFYIRLVFIRNTFNSTGKVSTKHQNTNF